jgi:hypothetical protein
MYKKDYHPDENLIYETEHYKFPVSKSTTEDPDLNRAVKIDEAMYYEAKVRLNEDTKLSKKIDDEAEKRENTDIFISNSLTDYSKKMSASKRVLPDVTTAIGRYSEVHSCACRVGDYASIINLRGYFNGTTIINLSDVGLRDLTTTSNSYSSSIQGTIIGVAYSHADINKQCRIVAVANKTNFEVRTNISVDDDLFYFTITFMLERNIT